MNNGLRILLLDDDAFMLEMLQEMVNDLGYANVHSETDARRALKALPQFKPDLLVCDLSMPEMDGIEFLRTVAEQHYGGSVILLSGMDSGILRAAETLAMAQGLTILGACSKPLATAQLADLLALASSRQAARSGTR
ncbi:response regulator receiver domain-containing protein [Pseudoduganella flava]|uniref:Response regulator n=1 Tax=Pseudoduganella flava TaxID=871742 RepID=A0A562PWA5_9BURK|nr:response regulator [Pseudoduganella flava]QGZ39795.1 response regulator [Pseudoduganella flava]TWI48714.1 response regulator receiver domain-containing protein [Pseudoduganella flava]